MMTLSESPAGQPPTSPVDGLPLVPLARARRARTRHLVLAIFGAAMAIVFVLPLFWMAVVSLRPVGLPPPRTVEWWPADPQWGNYVEIFRQVPLARYLLNSVLVVAVSVPLTLLTASLGGFGLSQLRDPWRQRLVIATVFLLMVPPSAVWLFRYQMLSWTGLLTTLWPSGFPSSDILEIYAFHVDWTTPANSTFTKLPDIVTAEFDSSLCGLSSFYCMGMPGVAQGSSSSLDPIREVIMNRLAYRQFGDHETLVGNFVTDINGNNIGGVRWFELRKVGAGAWSLYQEGTYAPTTSDNRWMGGIAMDGAGNIALGYNVSSQTVYPSLRYAGRLASDPLGTLPQGEYTLINGSGVNGSNRYGDYAAMSIDPVDDCTFWFTGQWNAASQWSTRIGAFKFDACGTPDFILSAAPASQEICVGANAVYNVTIGSVSGYSDPVTLSASGNPGTAGFSTNPVTPPGSSTMTISGAAAGSYNFDVVGTAAGPNVHQAPVGLTVQAAAPGTPVLTAPTNGALNVVATPTFTWNAVPGASTYSIQVATDADFTNIVATASGLAVPTWTSNVTLNTSTMYYWRVQAGNACGSGAYSSVFSFTTVAAPGDCGPGTVPNVLLTDGFEGGIGSWASSGTGNTWALANTNPHSGTAHMHANDPATVSDQRLVSPAVTIPTGQNPVTLKFWHVPNLEPSGSTNCYDGGILESSTDAGATWTQVPNANLLAGPYRSGTISGSFGNPLAGLNAWCGVPSYMNTIADVSALAGTTAQFRWRLGSDSSVSNPGWDVDDVIVQSCMEQPTAVEVDNFEDSAAATTSWLPVALALAMLAGAGLLLRRRLAR